MKNIKRTYIIFSILLVIVASGICVSFAFLTNKVEQHGKLNIVAGTLDYKLESNDLEDNQITVAANTIEVIEISITSLNSISSKYELYYNLNQVNKDVIVGYSDDYDLSSGNIESSSKKKLKVFINNKSDQQVIVEFGVEGGLTNSELVLSKGNSLVVDSNVPTVALNSNLPTSVTKGDSYTILENYTTSDLSGGSASCSSDLDGTVVDTSQLTTLGTHTITCTAETGAGKTVTASKTVKITYDAYTATNLITNGSFEDGTNNWYKGSEATFSVSNGIATIGAPTAAWNILIGTDYIIGNSSTHAHKFYLAVNAKAPSTAYSYGFGTQTAGGYVFFAPSITYESNQYTKSSTIASPSTYVSASDFYFGLYHRVETSTQETVYIDYVLIIDLTETFGSGNEPDKDWCDRHINYFDGTATVYK